ncbi:signal transduction histidine kinase [Actinoplanes lutulentus]|uniref:sensor histidine kinase n=1 Tax=Actinoplanes lutulentus TaxID=1287878 RepID=UPI0017EAC951|nr:histidine kinase [Actinoplanes lutulentus]MBB2940344.1 signal transduction histidine kinase [Actinoplanes lutulentus]
MEGIRKTVAGLLIAVLALAANLTLFVASLVSVLLIPVLGIGIVVMPHVVVAVRFRADLERRFSARFGVPIAVPYRSIPVDAPLGSWRRFRMVIADPATWRDFSWLLPGAIITGVLGIVGLAAGPYPIRIAFRFSRLLLGPTAAAALRRRVETLTVSRADTVDAQAAELRRIERDLHDGAQARLVALGMNIGLAEALIHRDPVAAHRLLVEAREASGQALGELRQVVRGILPPVLSERGLEGAVSALALTLPMPVDVEADLPCRMPAPVESAAYFSVAEMLANVVKHSGARHVGVGMRFENDLISMVVRDDGDGGADPEGGSGMRGVQRRLAAFDGTMSVTSPPGGPTVVNMELPCVLSSPKTSRSSATD